MHKEHFRRTLSRPLVFGVGAFLLVAEISNQYTTLLGYTYLGGRRENDPTARFLFLTFGPAVETTAVFGLAAAIFLPAYFLGLKYTPGNTRGKLLRLVGTGLFLLLSVLLGISCAIAATRDLQKLHALGVV